MIKKGLIILFALLLISQPVEAKTVYRYATKTVSLKEQPKKKSATIEKLRQNDKVILLKKGKRWSRVKYGENVGYCKTKFLNSRKSPKLYTRKQFKRRGRSRSKEKPPERNYDMNVLERLLRNTN